MGLVTLHDCSLTCQRPSYRLAVGAGLPEAHEVDRSLLWDDWSNDWSTGRLLTASGRLLGSSWDSGSPLSRPSLAWLRAAQPSPQGTGARSPLRSFHWRGRIHRRQNPHTPKFSLSSDFGHFILKMLENGFFLYLRVKKLLKHSYFWGTSPADFSPAGDAYPAPRFRRPCTGDAFQLWSARRRPLHPGWGGEGRGGVTAPGSREDGRRDTPARGAAGEGREGALVARQISICSGSVRLGTAAERAVSLARLSRDTMDGAATTACSPPTVTPKHSTTALLETVRRDSVEQKELSCRNDGNGDFSLNVRESSKSFLALST